MTSHLKSRHIAALAALREECDYRDGRNGDIPAFVPRGKMPPGTGVKTLADLLALGLIVTDGVASAGGTGYRITDSGRAALDLPAPPKSAHPIKSRLAEAKPRLQALPPRLSQPRTR